MENNINAIVNIYLYVKTESSLEQHYVLEPDQNTINIISKEDYDLHSKGSAIIYINCTSLKILHIDLNDYSLDIMWDAHGRIRNRVK
ncbi:hypothetical protein MBANPS3_002625 [Mucor bainieri]